MDFVGSSTAFLRSDRYVESRWLLSPSNSLPAWCTVEVVFHSFRVQSREVVADCFRWKPDPQCAFWSLRG